MVTIPISGVIGWDVTAQDIREALQKAGGEDVLFEVSSPGGFVSVGLEIYNLIRNYGGHTTARLSGYAMSMASYIPMACDRREAEDNAVFMIHNARGGVWGDHNNILSYGNYVKGLSGLIGKQYVKTTGKDVAEILKWMDDETYFFGDEMVEAGFVHAIIETDKDDDKESAMAAAQAIFTDTVNRMSADATALKNDMIKASAIMNVALPTPAVAGKPEQEVQQMAKLKELLTANPAAQAEYDQAMADARKAGVAEKQTVIDSATPILSSEEYPAAIKAVALKTLKGEASADTLTTTVAVFDAMKEQNADAEAAAEGAAAGETRGQQPPPPVDPTEPVSDEAGLEVAIAAARKEG